MPLPIVVKQTRELGRTLGVLDAAGEPEELLAGLAEGQLAEVEEAIDRGEQRLARLRAALRAARGGEAGA